MVERSIQALVGISGGENEMSHLLRIELWCGSDETPDGIARAEERYRRADEVARGFDVPTYFDIHTEKDGTTYADGYVYPCSENAIDVLRALERADVEFDNVDLPVELEGGLLHKQLLGMYPPGQGIMVNVGEIGKSVCEKHSGQVFGDFSYFTGHGVRRPGWFYEFYRHALAARGVRTK